MPQFRFKIKGYLNETGEYTELHVAESATILQLILRHWFNETLPNGLDIVYIQNESGDELVIDHVKRDIFEYFFIEKKSIRMYYHKKTDIQFMFFVLESFFNHRNQDLKHNFTASSDDWKFVRGDFIGKNFTYVVDRKLIWKNLDSLLYPIFVLLGAIIVSFFTSYLVILVGIGFCLVFAFGMYSTLIRLRAYYEDNKDLSIRFSRGDEFLHLKKGTWSRSIPKNEIRGIVKYIHPVDDSRVIAEYHTEIEFLNGNVLNLTCLMVPQDEIENKFSNDLVPIDFRVITGNKLARPTNLDKYFSAVKPIGVRDPGQS